MSLCVSNGGGFLLQLLEDVRDHRWVLNAGDHFDLSVAELTHLNINIEHALDTLHPGHDAIPFFRALIKPVRGTRISLRRMLASFARCDLNAVFAVSCKNAVKPCLYLNSGERKNLNNLLLDYL